MSDTIPSSTRSYLPLEGNTLFQYFQSYGVAIQTALSRVNPESLDAAYEIIQKSVENQRVIFVAGNGGSAAISNHLCCDWTKGTYHSNFPKMKTWSLAANTSVLTALANDCGYENSFSTQLEMLGQKGDVLLLISSSGSSPNILKAARKAKEMDIPVIAFTGFDGGTVRPFANALIHVPYDNYGIVEDCHQILMHSIAQYIAKCRTSKK